MCYKTLPYVFKSHKYKNILEYLDRYYIETFPCMGNLGHLFDFYSLEDEERFAEYIISILPPISDKETFLRKADILFCLLNEVKRYAFNNGKDAVIDEIEQDDINFIKSKVGF